MLRVFGHFLPIPPVILAAVEAALLTLALTVVVGPGIYVRASDAHRSLFAIALSLSVIFAMLAGGLYNADTFLDRRVAFIRVLITLILATPISLVIFSLFTALSQTPQELDRYWPMKAALAWLICLGITRTTFSTFSNFEIFKRRILVLGSGIRALEIETLAKKSRQPRFVPVAFVSACGDPRLVTALSFDVTSDDQSLEACARHYGAKEIVIAPDDRRGLPVDQLLRCKLSGISIVDYQGFCERESGRVDLEALQPSWFILSDGFRFGPWLELAKRSVDVAISLAMLVTVLPVLALTILAIKLESPGPILYRQERVGLRGRRFVLLKFRSMYVDAEKGGVPQWAQRGDRRVTRVGAFIRKARIDELPQLLNVLRGDMSFVGPRPERPYFVKQLAKQIPYYGERHAVRPGITGWAQINYPYGASVEDARQKLSYDLYYLKHRSVFLDLVILIQTVRVILWPQGVR